MRRSAPPLARRFHRRGAGPLRYWERAVFLALHAVQPERRLWANVLADALYLIYRSGVAAVVREELDWLTTPVRGSLMCFADLAPIFDIDPADVQRDVLDDVRCGRIRAKVTLC